jgi:hypothetical protein
MQSQRNQQSADRPEHELDEERSQREREPEAAPEDRPGDKLPGMPAKDDPTPVGDTDQHSTE